LIGKNHERIRNFSAKIQPLNEFLEELKKMELEE